MKTMRAPKMDVVRFTESDVIVASNIVYDSYLSGFNNEIARDGQVTFMGVTYEDSSSLNSALSAKGLAGTFQGWIPNQPFHSTYVSDDMFYLDAHADQVIYDENNTVIQTSVVLPDGRYVWNGSMFVHQ